MKNLQDKQLPYKKAYDHVRLKFESYFSHISLWVVKHRYVLNLVCLLECRLVLPIYWATARRTVKISIKYYFYTNFQAKKKDRISHHWKVQNKNFLVAQNKNFSVTSKYHLSINLLSKKDRIFHHQKVQNKNFSVTSKYRLSINFFSQKKTVFPIPKKFKKRLFSNQ